MSGREPEHASEPTTAAERTRTPLWRGFRAAALYYVVAVLVFLLLKLALPLRHDVYLFFVFMPAVLLVGALWAVVSVIAGVFRVWPRGALIPHVVVILLACWLVPPKPPVFPKAGPNPVRGDLMPTFHTLHDQRQYLSDYQRELESWPVPTEERDVDTAFGRTHVVSFGNPQGQPLVLLHQFYTNATEWKYMAPFLRERHRVYAVDVIGDMGKSLAYDPPNSEQAVSQWLTQVLDGLGLSRVPICGHSNGGFEAMLMAQHAPDRTEKLILLAPAAAFKPFSAKFYLTVFGAALYPNDTILGTFRNASTVRADLFSKEATEMLSLSFRVGANQVRVYPREFSDDEVRAIKAPTLVILGNEEMIYSPAEVAERASRLLPKSRVLMLSGCGHAIPFDAPKEAAAAIDSF
ncbi:MAG TPA: alpha/beta hydrolase [Thermoanaerobaculia bacterium]|nr:alpha/beta hydrolase [Thermoanaerobaculia bacterium]